MMLSQREDSKMALASTSVHVAEQTPQNGSCQYLWSQGEPQVPPTSLGGSSRSAGRSDPGFFQITASTPSPLVCEILYKLFKSERATVYFHSMNGRRTLGYLFFLYLGP